MSRCGARAEVIDGTFRALLPDPSHPTGKAICLKGKAAPEIVYHRSRLLHPLRRTRPKDVADPGWERCAKSLFFCETQHRQVASLRKSARDPQVEMHPSTAAARGIAAGDWISLETPHGSIRARAKFNPSLDPQVVFGQHSWWEACDELGLPGYRPYGPDSANLNLVLRQTPSDPISGSSPLRASVCDVILLSAVVSEK